MFAVSKRLTPASRHMSTCLLAPATSVEPTLLKAPRPPKVIVPSVRAETNSPERPSLRYSIRYSLHGCSVGLGTSLARGRSVRQLLCIYAQTPSPSTCWLRKQSEYLSTPEIYCPRYSGYRAGVGIAAHLPPGEYHQGSTARLRTQRKPCSVLVRPKER